MRCTLCSLTMPMSYSMPSTSAVFRSPCGLHWRTAAKCSRATLPPRLTCYTSPPAPLRPPSPRRSHYHPRRLRRWPPPSTPRLAVFNPGPPVVAVVFLHHAARLHPIAAATPSLVLLPAAISAFITTILVGKLADASRPAPGRETRSGPGSTTSLCLISRGLSSASHRRHHRAALPGRQWRRPQSAAPSFNLPAVTESGE